MISGVPHEAAFTGARGVTLSPEITMNDATTTVEQLKDQMRRFVKERDWEQFHDLKNLSMAIAVEAAELMDHFRWVPNTGAAEVVRDPAQAHAVRHEVADVLLLVLEFAMMAGIDLSAAAAEKLDINRKKYPVETAKGNARKHRA
jgi:dCTP diphosphatase